MEATSPVPCTTRQEDRVEVAVEIENGQRMDMRWMFFGGERKRGARQVNTVWVCHCVVSEDDSPLEDMDKRWEP